MERKGFVCPFCAKYYRDSEEKHQYNGWTMCKNCCDRVKKHEGLILEEYIAETCAEISEEELRNYKNIILERFVKKKIKQH